MARTLLNRKAGSGEPRAPNLQKRCYRFGQFGKGLVLSLLIFANSVVLFGQSEDTIYRLPAGTRISVELDAEINSHVSSVNDTFLARVTRPVRIREAVVVPIGSIVEGRVVSVERAAAANHNGSLEVVFESIKLSEQVRRIDAVKVSPAAPRSSSLFRAMAIGIGIVAGAVIGSASNTGKGPVIGAAAGAGVGTSIALLKKGKDVRIRKSDEFEIELKRDVTLPVLDY